MRLFKPAQFAERKWQNLYRCTLPADVTQGVQFEDGIKVAAQVRKIPIRSD